MSDPAQRRERFLELHRPGDPLLLPNPWDAGSARLFASLGFQALATTSSGFAPTLGRPDGDVTRDEALGHARTIAAATPLPVTADLENGFADEPEAVAETVRLVCATRLALTARAENHLRGVHDLSDTIRRLQSYQEAGADVLYAPGLVKLAEIEQVVRSVGLPVNVLVFPGAPNVAELASVGVARISVGGSFSLVSFGAVAQAARELLESGTYGFLETAHAGRKVRDAAFA